MEALRVFAESVLSVNMQPVNFYKCEGLAGAVDELVLTNPSY